MKKIDLTITDVSIIRQRSTEGYGLETVNLSLSEVSLLLGQVEELENDWSGAFELGLRTAKNYVLDGIHVSYLILKITP